MINLQTLLSTFDEKGTLLKWLKKVEAALANASLETVQVVVVDATHIKMKFVFADGTSVESPSIALPRGPQGVQGEQGPQGPTGPTGPQGESGTEVIANPTLAGTETELTGLSVNGTKYKVPTGGSGGGTQLYHHTLTVMLENNTEVIQMFTYSLQSVPFNIETFFDYLPDTHGMTTFGIFVPVTADNKIARIFYNIMKVYAENRTISIGYLDENNNITTAQKTVASVEDDVTPL